MKLHLPKGLRAALLAVVALVASSQTASAAAASYETLLSHLGRQTKTWISHSSDGGGGNFDFTYANGDPILANSTDWVLNVGLYNISPYPDGGAEGGDYLGATVLTNSGFTIDMGMDTLTLKVDHSQAILISPRGSVRFIASGDRPDKENVGNFLSETDIILGKIAPNWMKKYELDKTTINLKLSFAWDADGGKVIDGVQYGALKFLGGWIPDPNTGANLDPIASSLAGSVIIDNYAMPEDFLSISDPGNPDATSKGGLYSFPGIGGTVMLDLYTTGSDTAWAITGTASLNDLQAGGYEDTTGDEPVARAMQPTDDVQFIGDAGTIYLELPEDYTEATPYKETYSNPTTAEVDIRNGGSTQSIGFGADANTELTVASTVLDSTIFSSASQLPTGLRISGAGTVVLDLGDTGRNVNLTSLGSASNLKLQTTSNTDAGVSLATATVGANATIVRDKAIENASGDGALDVYLYDWQTPASSKALKSIENKVGGINILGTSYSADYSEVYYSYLKLADLKATGDIVIESDLTATDEIDAGGNISVYGVVDAGAVKSGGYISIGGAYDNTCALEATTIEAASDIDCYGSISAATITAGGDVIIYTAPGATNKLVGDEVYAASVTQATSAGADNYEITITSAPALARTATPLLSGNVVVNTNGIVADEIAAGATIELETESTGSVTARKSMADATIEVGNDEVITGATTDAGITISATRTAATGTLATTGVELPDGYTISADKLTVATSLEAGATTITAATGEAAVLDKVTALSNNAATVGSITADTVEIGADYTVNNAAISAATGTEVGDNATLNNVSIEAGSLTNTGIVNLNNTEFSGGYTFGGAQGDAITVDPNGDGVESVQITGTLNGDSLNVDSMVLNAEDLVFGNTDTHYEILAGDDLAYAPGNGNYTLNIESYVRAALSFDPTTGVVTITGYKDEEGIKDELTSSDNRQATMDALDEAILDAEAGSPLARINEYIGHVNRYDLADRQEVLDAVSGASLTALADSQRRGVQDVQHNLRNRIIQMGGGTNAGLTTDWDYVGLQAWAQADGGLITTDGSGDECGYDYSTWGATVGANIDLTANTVVGMSFSASYGELDVDSADNASGNNDAYYVSLFARHQKERWVQMLILTAGMNDFDMERTVRTGNTSYTGDGSTSGTTLSAYYEVGYTFGLNYEFTHILQPLFSVSITSAKVDGYTENGTLGNAALSYDDGSYFYGTVGLGVRYQGVLYETVHERNAVLEARALVTQDFGDTTDEASVSIGSSDFYKVKGADSSGTGFELGVGVSIPVEQHTTLYADIDATIRPDSTGFRGNLGVRYDF